MEAKTDLARLQEVRARREAAAAQREAEAAGEFCQRLDRSSHKLTISRRSRQGGGRKEGASGGAEVLSGKRGILPVPFPDRYLYLDHVETSQLCPTEFYILDHLLMRR